jgi:bifunctional non-homologous end joining protein LigD
VKGVPQSQGVSAEIRLRQELRKTAILIAFVRVPFQPMPLQKRKSAFNDSDFTFEIKWDGFRALALIAHGRTQLLSRNGHRFAYFADLERLISAGLPDTRAVIDGEICSLDKRGRPQVRDLLFHRGNYPCFLAVDLLIRDGKDCRRERLLDRKQELRRVLNGSDARIQYVDYVDGAGIPLFEQICKHDLEGVVAKQKNAPYVADREQSTWYKIRNPRYSQSAGREKLFERERRHEPVADWDSCVLACVSADAL